MRKKAKRLNLTDLQSRLRGFILDSQIQNAHEVSLVLGCSNISDDVALKEEQESDKRVDKISSLIPLLYAYARLLSEGTTEYQRTSSADELAGLPPELWSESKKLMEQYSFSVLVGAISQLIDMGLLTIPKDKK